MGSIPTASTILMSYRIVIDPNAANGIEFRGDNRKAIACRSQEMVLAGAADTGKTWSMVSKLHLSCSRYAGSQHGLIRKTYASIAGSVLQTFVKVLGGWADGGFSQTRSGAEVVGGDQPKKILYQNGSTVWIGGMDKPERVLSSERDTIYVNQAEELAVKDWEILSTRCTGRGAVVRTPQLFGDCNPGGSKHWIRERAKAGSLTLLNATHRDNPTIYDKAGNITPDGTRRLAALDKLTGVRYKRLKCGIWATAEGAVYEMFDAATHAVARPDTDFVNWFLALDEGYTNPQVTLLIGEDSDKRWHVAREFYVTGKLESDIVAHALGWFREKNCSQAACDAAAAGLIAALNNAGVHTKGGKGGIVDGIHKLQDRLKVQPDGKPRLTVDPSCVNTINEFESYTWKDGKDVPVDDFNHALGALRYLQDVLETQSAGEAKGPGPGRERVAATRGQSMW